MLRGHALFYIQESLLQSLRDHMRHWESDLCHAMRKANALFIISSLWLQVCLLLYSTQNCKICTAFSLISLLSILLHQITSWHNSSLLLLNSTLLNKYFETYYPINRHFLFEIFIKMLLMATIYFCIFVEFKLLVCQNYWTCINKLVNDNSINRIREVMISHIILNI